MSKLTTYEQVKNDVTDQDEDTTVHVETCQSYFNVANEIITALVSKMGELEYPEIVCTPTIRKVVNERGYTIDLAIHINGKHADTITVEWSSRFREVTLEEADAFSKTVEDILRSALRYAYAVFNAALQENNSDD